MKKPLKKKPIPNIKKQQLLLSFVFFFMFAISFAAFVMPEGEFVEFARAECIEMGGDELYKGVFASACINNKEQTYVKQFDLKEIAIKYERFKYVQVP